MVRMLAIMTASEALCQTPNRIPSSPRAIKIIPVIIPDSLASLSFQCSTSGYGVGYSWPKNLGSKIASNVKQYLEPCVSWLGFRLTGSFLTSLPILWRFSARGTGRPAAISLCFWPCSTGKGQCVQHPFASLSTLRCACPAGTSYNEISFAKLLLADLLARRPPRDHALLDPSCLFAITQFRTQVAEL